MTSSPSTTTLFSPTISAPSLSRSGSSFVEMLSPVDSDTGADQLPVLAYEPCKASAPSITKDEVLAATPKRPSLLARLGRAFGVCPQRLRAPAAEFFGTMILLLVGTGVNCQVVLSQDSSISASPQGDHISSSLGWASAVALGIAVSGGISGGHLNPAVTLAMAVFRGFAWRDVPLYVFAQLLGAFCGASITYGTYAGLIDKFENGRRTMATAGLFATFTNERTSAGGAFLSEFTSTALLVFIVFAITGPRSNIPAAAIPAMLFVTVLAIASGFGMQTGFALNPARDLGPRILSAMVGYGGNVFTYRSHYWIWGPMLAPICGALCAGTIHEFLFCEQEATLISKPKLASTTMDEKHYQTGDV